MNISDTIILWTKDDSFESLKELIEVSFDFNWRLNRYHFPVRGCLVYDSIEAFSHYQESVAGGTYNVNSIFGKGLVHAHIKAEELNMAGCIIDQTVFEKINGDKVSMQLIDKYAEKYETSFKSNSSTEYVFRFWINKKLDEETVKNAKKAIRGAFEDDNKGMNARSEELYKNTAEFVEYFLE